MLFAARYSHNIETDLKREHSFCSWLAEVGETKEECMELFLQTFPLSDISDVVPIWCDDVEGYLPARYGICAFVADTKEEAIALAKENWDGGGKLYVFPCTIVGDVDSLEEIEMGAARVLPTGEVKEVK